MRTFSHWIAVLLGYLLFTGSVRAEEAIPWQKDLNAAKQLAAQSNRLVLIHFWATWCEPCRRLDRDVFSKPGLGRALSTNYVPVKLNWDHHKSLAEKYGVRYLPWDVIVTPQGELVQDMKSPRTAELYVSQMTAVAQAVKSRNMAMLASRQEPNSPPAGEYCDVHQHTSPAPQATAETANHASGPGPNGRAAQALTVSGPTAPPREPVFAMDGFCPVHLVEKLEWTAGDRRYGAVHRGQTYLFAGPECQRKFLADPDRYSPAFDGHDPVAYMDRGQTLPGRRQFGCLFGPPETQRLVLFADEAAYQAFSQNPQRYAALTARGAR